MQLYFYYKKNLCQNFLITKTRSASETLVSQTLVGGGGGALLPYPAPEALFP